MYLPMNMKNVQLKNKKFPTQTPRLKIPKDKVAIIKEIVRELHIARLMWVYFAHLYSPANF